MPVVDVVRTYLEMREPAALRPAPAPPGALVRRLAHPTVAEARALYRDVGARYHWRDRDAWSDERMAAHLALRSVSLWVLEVDGATAGWFELKHHFDDSVEIAYFGLLQRFIGRGLGKFLLTRAVQEAWAMDARRVWVHTCTLDDPAALPNYQGRGMVVTKTEQYQAEVE